MGQAFITRRGGNINIENLYDLIPIGEPSLSLNPDYDEINSWAPYILRISDKIFTIKGAGVYNFIFVYDHLTISVTFECGDTGFRNIDPLYLIYDDRYTQYGGSVPDYCVPIDDITAELISSEDCSFIKGFAYYTPYA